MDGLTNFSLRDEIRAYWSARAATFDLCVGHEIFSEEERLAWQSLFLRHLGMGEGRRALDLASGTGVISHLLDDVGFAVTGMDWSEQMLALARAKADKRGRNIVFHMGDAENTMEPDESFDVIVNRHLVWTLVDPKAAFQEWFRLLKPGGTLLIVDGDFVNSTVMERLLLRLSSLGQRYGLLKTEETGSSAQLMATHDSILSRVYFSNGARAEEISVMLQEAGFMTVDIDRNLREIHREQGRKWNIFKSLARATQHRYAICARKA